MQRFIIEDLLEWKRRPDRKPLILKGARQTGKTYILKQFAADYYDSIAYVNFDFETELKDFFQKTKDPERIIEQLTFSVGHKITPGKTLIFFDEIQECPEALNSLKYFKEMAPEHHVVAAGSLLGVRLAQTSFPVGQVNTLELHPLSFAEFLIADGRVNLVDYINHLNDTIEPLPATFFSQLEEKLKAYMLIGGMPEVVADWVANRDIIKAKRIQAEILDDYERDFSKHVSVAEANKISLVWHGTVSQLAKENKKFIYSAIRESARARDYENAINWLRDAGLIYKIPCITKPELPLRAYEDLDAFKIYLLDVGLLSCMADAESSIAVHGDQIFTEFKGALTENYVVQALHTAGEKTLCYYTFDRYEIDLLLKHLGHLYPAEIKSGAKAPHRSLTRYVEKYEPALAIRFSSNNLIQDGKILNIPLALAGQYRQFLPQDFLTNHM